MRKCGLVMAIGIVVLCWGSTPAAPTLDVGLLVEGLVGDAAYVGWPLVFEVSFANQGAWNVALGNRELEEELAQLEALVASGIISGEEAARVREGLALQAVEPIVLGAESVPWTSLLSFESADDLLPWDIHLLADNVPAALVLDETYLAIAWYGLSAEAAERIAPGTYTIVVVISTEGVVPAPEGMWTGYARSSPARLVVLPEPEMTDALLTQKRIALGRYAMFAGAWADAEAHLLEAVKLDPSSVEAWIHLGEAQYLRGEPKSALDSFWRALELLLGARAGKELTAHEEPPSYVLLWIAKLEQELETKVPLTEDR